MLTLLSTSSSSLRAASKLYTSPHRVVLSRALAILIDIDPKLESVDDSLVSSWCLTLLLPARSTHSSEAQTEEGGDYENRWTSVAHLDSDILRVLVGICEARPELAFRDAKNEALWESWAGALTSGESWLREGCLRILTSSLSLSKNDPQSDRLRESLRLCLVTESVSLDIQGVRERILRMRKAAVEVAKEDVDKPNVEVTVRWLLGMCPSSFARKYSISLADATYSQWYG